MTKNKKEVELDPRLLRGGVLLAREVELEPRLLHGEVLLTKREWQGLKKWSADKQRLYTANGLLRDIYTVLDGELAQGNLNGQRGSGTAELIKERLVGIREFLYGQKGKRSVDSH